MQWFCAPRWNFVSSFFGYIQRVRLAYGTKFVILLVCVYAGVKGLLMNLVSGAQLPFYKSLGFDSVSYQVYRAVISTPWAMKGLIGSLSDAIPFCGYSKKYYMLASCILGIIGVFSLSTTSSFNIQCSVVLLTSFFFFAQFEASAVDLLCEGKYVEIMAQVPETKADIVTFVWLCVGVGSFVSSLLVGPIADYIGVYLIFILCVPVAILPFIPIACNFLPEERISSSYCCISSSSIKVDKIRTEYKTFVLALALSCAALGSTFVGLFASLTIQFVYCIFSAFGLCVLCYMCLGNALFKCTLYIFLQSILHVSVGGSLDFFYTASPECLPNGPHFDYTYYATYTSIIAQVASGVGLLLFQTVFIDCSFRKIFWSTSILRSVASMFDLVLVKRWNVVWGLSDKVMYILGDGIICSVIEMLAYMPYIVLISRLCPKSMESTMYAILAGLSNFGSTIARLLGAYASDSFGIVATDDGKICNFTSLPFLIVLCHCIFPCFCIPLTFCLIPDAKMSESFGDDPSSTEKYMPVNEQSDLMTSGTSIPPVKLLGKSARKFKLKGVFSKSKSGRGDVDLEESSSSSTSSQEVTSDGSPVTDGGRGRRKRRTKRTRRMSEPIINLVRDERDTTATGGSSPVEEGEEKPTEFSKMSDVENRPSDGGIREPPGNSRLQRNIQMELSNSLTATRKIMGKRSSYKILINGMTSSEEEGTDSEEEEEEEEDEGAQRHTEGEV